jgi:hypothetical protein
MNTTDKKMYLIPETETLSLESVHSLMGGPSPQQNGPGGGQSNDPTDPTFGAPGRKVF